MPGALSGFRIIECGEMVSAAYASKLMADMGAEVIKIESPHGGDTARQRGPFPGGEPHAEKSGLYLFLNTNKRGITLDLEQPQGKRFFSVSSKTRTCLSIMSIPSICRPLVWTTTVWQP